jgi:hypothetical protein
MTSTFCRIRSSLKATTSYDYNNFHANNKYDATFKLHSHKRLKRSKLDLACLVLDAQDFCLLLLRVNEALIRTSEEKKIAKK